MKQTIASVLGTMPINWLQKINGSRFLLPYQHTVSNAHLPHIAEIYPYKSVAQFEEDVKYLKRYSNGLPIRSLLDIYLQKKPLPQGSVILSFDDGFSEIYNTIVPVLKHYQLEAVFFVNPSFIDNRQLFYRNQISLIVNALRAQPDKINQAAEVMGCNATVESTRLAMLTINNASDPRLGDLLSLTQTDVGAYLAQQQPYLTTAQLQTIATDGFLIGAHSYTHPYYHLLPIDQQVAETVDSMNWVVENIQPTHRLFSFPHSDARVSATFFEKMPAGCVDVYFGTQNMKEETQYPVLHRYNAERPATTLHQQTALVSSFAGISRLLYRHIVKRSAI